MSSVQSPKNLLTEKNDWKSIQISMTQIADILDRRDFMAEFDTAAFRKIPAGDAVFGPVGLRQQTAGPLVRLR